MPKISISVSGYDMEIIRKMSRHEKKSEALVARSLLMMGLKIIRSEIRTGWYLGDEIKMSQPPKKRKEKKESRYSGWTKEERDSWILEGRTPDRAMKADTPELTKTTTAEATLSKNPRSRQATK